MPNVYIFSSFFSESPWINTFFLLPMLRSDPVGVKIHKPAKYCDANTMLIASLFYQEADICVSQSNSQTVQVESCIKVLL